MDGTNASAKMDDMVAPNSTVVYTWTVPDHFAPTNQDPDCLTMVYTSGVNPVKDVYSGRDDAFDLHTFFGQRTLL